MTTERTERIWRCSCGGAHFLSVQVWDDGDLYLIVEEHPVTGHWERLVACWKLLRHRRHTWIEILLTPAQAAQIAGELTDKARLLVEGGSGDKAIR